MRRERLGLIVLDGYWSFARDPSDTGEGRGYSVDFPEEFRLYVPASWNEQVPDLMNYTGVAWYKRDFLVPPSLDGLRAWIVFEGVNYLCKVWLNGELLGAHEGGFSSFRLGGGAIRYGAWNRLVVKVDNKITPESLPPGESLNRTYFDFYHYGGIQRPVYVEFTGPSFVDDITVRAGHDGLLRVEVSLAGSPADGVEVSLWRGGELVDAGAAEDRGGRFIYERRVSGVEAWCPENPVLYRLEVDVYRGGVLSDSVYEMIGFRTFEVREGALLLNGREVKLKGFSRHEDYPLYGRRLPGPAIVRDYYLMRWVGANSFRTSHYPYSRENLDMADAMGFLVILEAPTVGLSRPAHFTDGAFLDKCLRMIGEMVREHKNRPSVVMYSLANEPRSDLPEARGFFEKVAAYVREADPTRPLTLASHVHMMGEEDRCLDLVDVIGLNFYYGWYSQCGDLDKAVERLEADLERIHSRHPEKPILITEFGAGAVAGIHTMPPEMWSEEYQSEFIRRYMGVFRSKAYVKGVHIWNLADFKTPQSPGRVVLNRKGVFTRTREPKMAAYTVKEEFEKF